MESLRRDVREGEGGGSIQVLEGVVEGPLEIRTPRCQDQAVALKLLALHDDRRVRKLLMAEDHLQSPADAPVLSPPVFGWKQNAEFNSGSPPTATEDKSMLFEFYNNVVKSYSKNKVMFKQRLLL